MILILSRGDDGSTSHVTTWLYYFKKDYIRINGDKDNTSFIRYDSGRKELLFEHNGKEINLFDIKSMWYRRRGFSRYNLGLEDEAGGKSVFFDDIRYQKNHLTSEAKDLLDFFIYSVESNCEQVLGRYFKSTVNKLIVNDIAVRHGFQIPETFITPSKQYLAEVVEGQQVEVINKAISNGVYFNTGKTGYYSYTEKVDKNYLSELPDSFFPSLFQKKIEKRFELRVFYLKGVFYPMAIFSQRSKDTEVDFRKQNTGSSNRKVPFKLPVEVESKLRLIFEELRLDTGSADLIVDQDGQYIFLEINPIGQFGMTSQPCNYYLEKKIAEML